MTHGVLRNESPSEALRRLLRARVEAAEDAIADGHSGAHEARKRLREARACVALAREVLPRAQRRRLRELLREAAHSLTPLRDADALLERLGELRSDPPDGVEREDLALVRPVLAECREEARRGASETLTAARGALAAAGVEIAGLAVSGGWRRVLVGHAHSLWRARSAWRAAAREPTDERLHEWRKRLKDLRHQALILSPAMPEVLVGWADAWHEGSDLLGEHRDLGALIKAFRRTRGATALAAALAQRRGRRAKRALALGERLHRIDPEEHAALALHWLRSWQRDG
jgi:CHAD domain-containing protein